MGSDMANIKSGKSSNSTLKVPPLKIVLSTNQNNSTIVNVNNLDEGQSDVSDKGENNLSNHDQSKETGRRNSLESAACEVGDKQPLRRNSRVSPERKESELGQTSNKAATYSSSSSTAGSDRSTSTSPSSESESLDSNLTIISDYHQNRGGKVENQKEDNTQVKQDKVSRQIIRGASSDKTSNPVASATKKSQEISSEQSSDPTATSSKEQTLNANQRITRSSQRAAQQNKSDNPSDTNGDETNVTENQDKSTESGRKVKRRKGEPQENEQDNGPPSVQPTVAMANIYPADYQLPSQNSFELYRDIRKRPYNKMMKLSHVQPRVPHGFKDYLLNGGPYLLDGNKLGSGFNGSRVFSQNDLYKNGTTNLTSSRTLSIKFPTLGRKSLPQHASHHQRHDSYITPKLQSPPANLRSGSPLFNLFLEQERARYQMRMQHLKERERSILAAEQEVLRVYNRVAIADSRQKLHLSACTYFYYQERYHYSDEKSDSNECANPKEVPHNQDNSNLCIEGGDAPNKLSSETDTKTLVAKDTTGEDQPKVNEVIKPFNEPSNNQSYDSGKTNGSDNDVVDVSRLQEEHREGKNGESRDISRNDSKSGNRIKHESTQQNSDNCADSTSSSKTAITSTNQSSASSEAPMDVDDTANKTNGQNDSDLPQNDKQDTKVEATGDKIDPTISMSDEDLKDMNKSIFLDQLQEIDDKWTKIRKEMSIRHKNESDSLYAVQCLDWEWKAKEVGVCDVRVSFRIEPDLVPRVEISALDY